MQIYNISASKKHGAEYLKIIHVWKIVLHISCDVLIKFNEILAA